SARQVLLYRPESCLPHRHEAMFASLSHGSHYPQVQIQIGLAEFAQLAYAKARGVEQFHHGPVPEAHRPGDVRGLDDLLDLLQIQILRDSLPLLRRTQVFGRVGLRATFPEEVPEEVTQSGQVARDRAVAQSGPVHRVEVAPDSLPVRHSALFKK